MKTMEEYINEIGLINYLQRLGATEIKFNKSDWTDKFEDCLDKEFTAGTVVYNSVQPISDNKTFVLGDLTIIINN